MNLEVKYYEILSDLLYNKQFLSEIRQYRKDLGIPASGFANPTKRKDFRYKTINIINESSRVYTDIISTYSYDEDLVEKILNWKDFFGNGCGPHNILGKFKLPDRAYFLLTFFIQYSKSYIRNLPTVLKRSNEISRLDHYGCDYRTTYKSNTDGEECEDKLIKKIKDSYFHNDGVYRDLSAIIMIYPETRMSDVQKLIKDHWSAIEISQSEEAFRGVIKLRNVRKKTNRKLHEQIYKLHKKGLNSRQIASEMKHHPNMNWDYIRKVISDMKKREK